MNKKLTILFFVLIIMPTLLNVQWVNEGAWPDSSFKGGMHGLAVDPDGKVWVSSYFQDTPLVNGSDTVWTSAIWVFNADGTIYVGPVVGGGFSQIATYDTDLNYIGAAVGKTTL